MAATVWQAPPDAIDHGLDKAELRARTLPLVMAAMVGLAIVLILYGAVQTAPIAIELIGIVLVLVMVTWLAHLASSYQPRAAALVVLAGLLVVLLLALQLWPAELVAPWSSLMVLIAGALLGSRWGAVAATTTTAQLLLAVPSAPGVTRPDAVMNAIFLIWASLFVYWVISRPVSTALEWAWSSYRQAVERTREARERQAELARLSKSLAESYYRLEQLNLELERARRAAHEARQLKAQFAAAVSHELRTPLNLIIGFCEMMVLSPDSAYGQLLPSSYRGDLEAIYRNACHISALVDDILDLSQIDADRMALHREWTALRQIVDEAVATVETLFRNRELSLRVALPSDLLAIFVDRTRIRQILINLLSNAARFTEAGGVTVRAECDDDAVVVSVTDTGPGIPPSELPHVFEEFRQVSGAPWKRGGSGLGLAVSRRFAELHGGTMWVESTPGLGSSFYLKLPIATEEERAAGDRIDWDDRVATRVHGQAERRIVVVDESGEVFKVFQRYLDGYSVARASDVAKARRRCKVEPVQAVVLRTPEAQARWLEKRLDQRQGQTHGHEMHAGPLVIACTLHTPRRLAEQIGVAEYLVKPIGREQLRNALRRVNRAPRSVLVVDDDPEMNRLLARMIRSLHRDCAVVTASDGEQALDILRERRPDVVLLDLLMPVVNGYSVLEAIRGDPAIAATPVLVITAHGLQDEAVVASALSVTREGGLTVAEVMRWIKSGLDALQTSGGSAGAPPAALVG